MPTLIARFENDVPVTSLIDQPIVEDRWLSTDGQTSYHKGEICRASSCERLDDARLHPGAGGNVIAASTQDLHHLIQQILTAA